MVKIAITGNIAAGKSEVEKILSDKGYEVYDTDKFTHQILESSIEVKETFKNYDVFENGAVSRKKLGALVFQNPELKQKLEKIIHPKIKKIIEKIEPYVQRDDFKTGEVELLARIDEEVNPVERQEGFTVMESMTKEIGDKTIEDKVKDE